MTYTNQVVAYDAAGNTTPSGTLTVNTPNAGTLFSDGFEPATHCRWHEPETAHAHSGSYGAEESTTGASHMCTHMPKGPSRRRLLPALRHGLGVRGEQVHVCQTDRLPEQHQSASIMNLYLSPTGKLALRNNIGSVTTTKTTAMPTGGWHQVVLHLVVDGTASSVDVSLDGIPVSDLSLTGQNMGTNLITILHMGDTATGRTYDIDFDDISVSQTAL